MNNEMFCYFIIFVFLNQFNYLFAQQSNNGFILTDSCKSGDPICEQCKLCKNNALCRLNSGNKVTCYCVPGYAGTYCQIDINECLSQPCINNSTCVDQINMYTCECNVGYTGENCEEIISACQSQPCKFNTKCIDLPGGNYKCDCNNNGFTGKNCDVNINDCVKNLCTNNATCIDDINAYRCSCSVGYTGQYCNIPINPCNSVPCINNSTCKKSDQAFEYVCECRLGYTGRNCETKLNPCEKQPCGLNGYCVELGDSYMCNCKSGFTGRNCLQNINECETISDICMHNSTCIDLDPSTNSRQFRYICDCSTIKQNLFKFAGQNCSIKLDVCHFKAQKCENNSTCVAYLNENNEQDYYCQCKRGFAGKYCELSTQLRLDSTYFLEYNLNQNKSLLIKNYDVKENDLMSVLNTNDNKEENFDHITIKFDFRANLYKHKNYEMPLVYLKLVNNVTIELIINKYFIEIYLNSELNKINLPFLMINKTSLWHSIEIFIKLNFIQISYKVQNFNFNKKFVFQPLTTSLTSNGFFTVFNNQTVSNLQLVSFGIGKYLNDESENYIEACIRDLKLNEYYLFLNDSNVKYGCLKSTPDCSNGILEDSLVNSLNETRESECKNNAFCVNKLFDNECINCKEPYYGKHCEFKANDIRFDETRKSNLTIKILNINNFDLSFNFKPNFDLIESANKNEQLIHDLEDTDETSVNIANPNDEISFLYLTNNQTDEILKLSFTIITSNGTNNTKTKEAYLNFYAKNLDNNQLMLINFIKKPIINNKFYKLNIRLRENEISIKINELNLNLNIDYKFNNYLFNTFTVSNKFYGLLNSIKLNKKFININPNQQRQYIYLNSNNQYVVVEHFKCLYENCQQCSKLSPKCTTQGSQSNQTYVFQLKSLDYKLDSINFDVNIHQMIDDKSSLTPTTTRTTAAIRPITRSFNNTLLTPMVNSLNSIPLPVPKVFSIMKLFNSYTNEGIINLNLQLIDTNKYLLINNRQININPLNRTRISKADKIKFKFQGNMIELFINSFSYLKIKYQNEASADYFTLKIGNDLCVENLSLGLMNKKTASDARPSIFDVSLVEQEYNQTIENYFNSFKILNKNCKINLKLNEFSIDAVENNRVEQMNALYKCDLNFCENNSTCENILNYNYLSELSQPVKANFMTSTIATTTPSPYSFISKYMLKSDYTCKCNDRLKFSGRNCSAKKSICDYEFVCVNNGTCVQIEDTFKCLCEKNYVGERCEVYDPCKENLCSAYSTCLPKKLTPGYECKCNDGYMGEYCQIKINETCYLEGQCKNNGKCVDKYDSTGNLKYECVCKIGYNGKNCENLIDYCLTNKPCENNSTCHNLRSAGSDQYACVCQKGWKGQKCDQDIDECVEFPNICKHDSKCVNKFGSFECKCRSKHYYGEFCEHKHICAEDYRAPNEVRLCKNDGKCLMKGSIEHDQYECECQLGYTGEACTLITCDTKPCRNNGTCIDLPLNETITSIKYECMCNNTGFTGPLCDDFIIINNETFVCDKNLTQQFVCDEQLIQFQQIIRQQNEFLNNKQAGLLDQNIIKTRGSRDYMYHFIIWPLLGLMLILLMTLSIIIVMKMKKSRATRGTYSPSRHEQHSSRIEFNMDLKRPPEERLI